MKSPTLKCFILYSYLYFTVKRISSLILNLNGNNSPGFQHKLQNKALGRRKPETSLKVRNFLDSNK